MLHKIKLFGGAVLLLLGLGLAIGYPNGGVKNSIKYATTNKNNIPSLNKKGNEKNFLSKKKIIHKVLGKTVHEINHTKTTIKEVVKSHTVDVVKTKTSNVVVKQKPKTIVHKPIKKKIKLVTPPPPPEEEEDEGC